MFTAGGALGDLYDATITYNLRYSGETYAGPFAVVRYLLTFPIERASVDALWMVGGAGCLILLPLSLAKRERLVAPLWVAAACLSIAINGSRGLPQYFVQANPALALAAGWGAIEAWALIKARAARHAPAVGLALIVIVAVAVWRVDQFPKLVEQTLFDARYALGRIDRETYLSRYGDDRKYSALAAAALADTIRSRTHEGETVYVFGFTCAAYVQADRASASRFFWSRPVIAGFKPTGPDTAWQGCSASCSGTRRPSSRSSGRTGPPTSTDSAAVLHAHRAARRLARSELHPNRRPGRLRRVGPQGRPLVIESIDDRVRRRYVVAFLAIAIIALGLRLIFPAADPPWNPTVGVVWHDEGRVGPQRAQQGRCSAPGRSTRGTRCTSRRCSPRSNTASFELFGVGVRQARLVSELTGFAVRPAARAGASRGSAAGRPALAAGALLATNYVYVMYDRAATMEALDGRVHGRELVLLRRAPQERPRWGVARRRRRAAGVLHQGVRRVLRGRARARRAARVR